MTNEQWIQTASHNELIEFLGSLDPDFPWYDEFDKMICKIKCNRDTCLGVDCPFGDPINWWLKQQHREDD